MFRPTLAAACIAAAPALATQEYILPTLFDVYNVAADDVLNIRAAPSASAEIVGTLAPDATRIEVVGTDALGRWARINTGERSGWAALRYLMYRTDVWQAGALPETLSCLGTEPFWHLEPTDGTLTFSTPEIDGRDYRIGAIGDSGTFRDPRRAVTGEGHDGRITAVIVPAMCSDGMSDRVYGLDATVVIEGDGPLQLLRGCCSIAP